MKKLILISLMCFFSISSVLSQDIIYTISGQSDEGNIPLDSILIENITNGTKILFDDLPENPDYQINLTKKQYWGTTNINSLKEERGFVVLQNIPGKLSLLYSKNTPIDVNISIHNINGQKVYTSNQRILYMNSVIQIELESNGVFFVKLESNHQVQAFKSIGGSASKSDRFNIAFTEANNSKESLKSQPIIKNSDFDFEAGDSLRISAYKTGYYAPPVGLRVENSQSVDFQYKKNFFRINDNEYLIAGGILLQNEGNKPHELAFLSTHFNLANFEVDGVLKADTPGGIVDFGIEYTQDSIPSGSYYFSTAKDMNTESVCDKDINGDGIVNNDDCYYILPDGKFYISSNNSMYDGNIDINDEDYEPQFFFKTGTVIIKRNFDFYTVEFDCTGENGDILKGYYTGYFLYFNYE